MHAVLLQFFVARVPEAAQDALHVEGVHSVGGHHTVVNLHHRQSHRADPALLTGSTLTCDGGSPVRPPGGQTYLWEGGGLGAGQQNRPTSEQLVARRHRGKCEEVDRRAEKRLEVDWENRKIKGLKGEGDHVKVKTNQIPDQS